MKILDVGCGTGATALLFAEMGHQVAGIDLSGGMMKITRKKAEERSFTLEFQNGEVEEISTGRKTTRISI